MIYMSYEGITGSTGASLQSQTRLKPALCGLRIIYLLIASFHLETPRDPRTTTTVVYFSEGLFNIV